METRDGPSLDGVVHPVDRRSSRTTRRITGALASRQGAVWSVLATIAVLAGLAGLWSPAAQASSARSATVSKAAMKFGISYGNVLPWLGTHDLAAELNDARALGMKWVRVDLEWSDVQPDGAATYQWSQFDRVVSAARARGLSLLPVLTCTPSWARVAGAPSKLWAPASPARFASFAAAAVRRYAPKGIHTWEIWNEPNTVAFWGAHPSAKAYVALLRPTVAAMRKRDPKVFIVSGGLAPDARGFLAAMCALGANRLVDAIGYHPYSFPLTPQDPVSWNAWRQIAATRPSVRSILAAHGTPGLPIWATEYGAPTDGPGTEATAQGWPQGTDPDHASEAFQATLAADSVAAAPRTAGLRALFWYTDRDAGTDPSTTEDFFGLRRADGSAKPAFAALERAIKD